MSRLSIADKNGLIHPFVPNAEQRIYFNELEDQLDDRRPVRVVNLKARQIGISTATEAYIYCMSFVMPNYRSAVIADEVDNANHLLSMTDLYWETDPWRRLYSTKYQAKNTLMWHETASSVRTMTANNKKAGRSRTIHQLHASEVAFWLEAKSVMTGLLQAVPDRPRTFIGLESTANGIGNYFHQAWVNAESNENEYVALFFPWWAHKDYRASRIGLPYRSLEPLDEEERLLLVLFKQGLDVANGKYHFEIPESEWEDALAWRRWTIANKCDGSIETFHQEYPSTPDEAFIATGTNVFPMVHLRACFQPEAGQKGRIFRNGARVEWRPDVSGPITMFRQPGPSLNDFTIYIVGGDATATMRGDFACAQVINRRTLEQVAVYRGRRDPHHFANDLRDLGQLYNVAVLSPENEGPGYATIGALIQSGYPNIYQSQMPDNLPGRFVGKWGWSSSYKTKEAAIGLLLKLIIDHETIIHDRTTFTEMMNYVTLPGGGYGNADGEAGHDDTVMAYAIAVASNFYNGPILPAGSSDGPKVAPEWTRHASPLDGMYGVDADLSLTGGY